MSSFYKSDVKFFCHAEFISASRVLRELVLKANKFGMTDCFYALVSARTTMDFITRHSG